MSVEAMGYVKMLDMGTAERAATRLLLYVIAENVYNDTFRCHVGQEQLAFECGRISTRTVRRLLDTLEGADLIRCHRRQGDDGHRQPDGIEVVGFSEWFARYTKARRDRKTLPDKLSARVGLPDNLSAGLPDNLAGPTGQQVSGTIEDTVLSSRTSLPPAPQRGSERARKSSGQAVDDLLARLEAANADRAPVLAHLIGPVVRRRTFSAPDHEFTLGELADWIAAKGLTSEQLTAAAAAVIEKRRVVANEAAVREAVEAVEAQAAAARATGAASGEVELWPTRDAEACAAWADYYRAIGDRRRASAIEKFGGRVPSRTPPPRHIVDGAP